MDNGHLANLTENKNWKTLLYVPNVIGYARLSLILASYCYRTEPKILLQLYITSISLDFFDGWAARKLSQCSAFGAWLDVIVDNVSRSFIWMQASNWAWLIVSLEWITFVCNHQGGSQWKQNVEKSRSDQLILKPPLIVTYVMANGFKTRAGFVAIAGLHVLPVWIYAVQHQILQQQLSSFIVITVYFILFIGRMMCLVCELWSICKHVIELLEVDSNNE